MSSFSISSFSIFDRPRSAVYSSISFVLAVSWSACPAVAVEKGQSPVEISGTLDVRLNLVPAGDFEMGLSPSETRETEKASLRNVRIGRPFYLGRCEVTQGEFAKVVERSPWKGRPDVDEDPRNAASYVSWYDAVEFCNRLSEQEKLPVRYSFSGVIRHRDGSIERAEVTDLGGIGYRLPTEAEWEYACRAGTKTAWHCGPDDSRLAEYAWFGEMRGAGHPRPGAMKKPNTFGLFDMHGNVYEWCWNRHAPDRASPTSNDPVGRAGGDAARTVRGGSWRSNPEHHRSGYSSANKPTLRYDTLGFRIARNAAD
jgi:formylglycine-generating enzyme required for sulfatase activity